MCDNTQSILFFDSFLCNIMVNNLTIRKEKNMQIVLSTGNPSKVEQIKPMLAGSSISILTLEEAGIEDQAVEDGLTLQENALKKAMFVHQKKPGVWAMADDTGIFINHLGGLPGVNTARWSGGNTDTDQITQWILKQLESATDRSATFKTVVALISPEGEQYFFNGKVQGCILQAPRTKAQPKMPYSSIFVPEGTDKVLAEMTIEEENDVSHRGQAFRKARAFLRTVR